MYEESIKGSFIIYKLESLPKDKNSERITFFFFFCLCLPFSLVDILGAIHSQNWPLEHFKPGMECSFYTRCKWNRRWIHAKRNYVRSHHTVIDELGKSTVWTLKIKSYDPFILFHMRKRRCKEAKRLSDSHTTCSAPPGLNFGTGKKRHQADDTQSHTSLGMTVVLLHMWMVLQVPLLNLTLILIMCFLNLFEVVKQKEFLKTCHRTLVSPVP